MPPGRFVPTSDLRAEFGERVDRFGAALSVGDPLADAVVEELARKGPERGRRLVATALARGLHGDARESPALTAMFATLEAVPLWVDWPTLDRGGDVYRRHAALTQLALTCGSLPWSYASPAGNKPLTLTGRLVQRAPRRLAETAQFVVDVTRPGGLRRGGPGFAACVRVRLMHAEVRRRLAGHEDWRPAWGVPINQADLVATHLAFSLVVVDALAALGAGLHAQERADVLSLWRYAARLLGLDADLVPTDEAGARRTMQLVRDTQAPPDDDSRALTAALLQAAAHVFGAVPGTPAGVAASAFAAGLSRHLLGDALADGLAIPDTPWQHPARWLSTLASPLDRMRRRFPLVDGLALRAGDALWEAALRRGLEGRPATYDPRGS